MSRNIQVMRRVAMWNKLGRNGIELFLLNSRCLGNTAVFYTCVLIQMCFLFSSLPTFFCLSEKKNDLSTFQPLWPRAAAGVGLPGGWLCLEAYGGSLQTEALCPVAPTIILLCSCWPSSGRLSVSLHREVFISLNLGRWGHVQRRRMKVGK